AKELDDVLARSLAWPAAPEHHRYPFDAGSHRQWNPRVTKPALIVAGDPVEPPVVADQRGGLPVPGRVQDPEHPSSKFGAVGKSLEFGVNATVRFIPVDRHPGLIRVETGFRGVSGGVTTGLRWRAVANPAIGKPGPFRADRTLIGFRLAGRRERLGNYDCLKPRLRQGQAELAADPHRAFRGQGSAHQGCELAAYRQSETGAVWTDVLMSRKLAVLLEDEPDLIWREAAPCIRHREPRATGGIRLEGERD